MPSRVVFYDLSFEWIVERRVRKGVAQSLFCSIWSGGWIFAENVFYMAALCGGVEI